MTRWRWWQRWRRFPGERRIEIVILTLLTLVDLGICSLHAGNLVSDSAVLSCERGDGSGATCTVAEDFWFDNRATVYHHVTGAGVRAQDDGEGDEIYYVRLVGESGRVGPSHLTRRFWRREDAERTAGHLSRLIAEAPARSFSEQVRPRPPVWLIGIGFPLLAVGEAMLVAMVTSPVWTRMRHLARALMGAGRRLASVGLGVAAAVIVSLVRGQLRWGGGDTVGLRRRMEQLPERVRRRVGRRLVADRRSTMVLLEVAHRCFGDSPIDLAPIALHPNVSTELQERVLVNPAVGAVVAAHPHVPAVLLARLARDARDVVRAGVAGNPSATPDLLAELALDPRSAVRRAAMANPSATPGVQALAWFAN